MTQNNPDSIVGLWFNVLEKERCVLCSGQILAQVEPGLYLIRRSDDVTGEVWGGQSPLQIISLEVLCCLNTEEHTCHLFETKQEVDEEGERLYREDAELQHELTQEDAEREVEEVTA